MSEDPAQEAPSGPYSSLLVDQREANEQLLLAALRARDEAEEAHSGRILAQSESHALRLETAELLEAAEFRERFLSIIGHDLRNPLNTIVLAAQLLESTADLEAEGLRLAQRIVQSGQRMERMLDQLANFTRARLGGGFELQLGVCDLGLICGDVIEEMRLSSSVKIVFTTHGALEGSWDADRLAEVFSNLIGNATDHAAPNTATNVTVREDGCEVVAEICNYGPSIPPEALETIFSAFARGQAESRSAGGHLGLGLYISREIALAHGGELEVESADGKTTFFLRLPHKSER